MQSDIDYYRTRAAEERARAAMATDPAVRRAHEAMAARYERGAAGEKLDLGIVERG
jgi:Tfp pilus assembly protein PilF